MASDFHITAVKDVAAIQIKLDGTYDVRCDDGTNENVTDIDLTINNVCPYVAPGKPSCIQSMVKLADGTFRAICKDGSYDIGDAAEVIRGDVCECRVATPTPAPTPVPTATPIPPETVDILVLIDDSGSMYEHQTNLAANITKFVNNLGVLASADWHIGVATTDLSRDGELFGTPTFFTPKTPSLINDMVKSMQPGTNGAPEETHFDSIYAALTEPMLSTKNAGFYRRDAHLAIVFITDAEDQSANMTTSKMQNFLVNLKNGTSARVLTYGILADSRMNPRCTKDDQNFDPVKITDLIRLNNGKIFDLCDPDWGKKLEVIAKDIVVQP